MKKSFLFVALAASLSFSGCDFYYEYQPETKEKGDNFKEITLSFLRIIKNPSKLVYKEGEALNPSGLLLRAYYSDNSTKDIPVNDLAISDIDQTTGKVTVSYNGLTAYFYVTIEKNNQNDNNDPVAVKITGIYGLPESIEVGESLNSSTLTAKVEYSDGSIKNAQVDSIDFDSSKAGNIQGTAHVGTLTFSFTLTVAEKEKPPVSNAFTLVTPINNQSVEIIDSQVRTYLNDFKNSRKSIKNDYLFDKDACDENLISSHEARIVDYVSDNKDHSKAKEVTFSFTYNETSSKYYVLLATKQDFSDAKEYETTSKTLGIRNLLRNTKYYWKVLNADKTKESLVEAFVTEDAPRFIYTDKLNNVRDFGGYLTKSGKRIKQGLIFRGHEINVRDYVSDNSSKTSHHENATDNVKDTMLNELGIKVEFDLRSVDERDPNLVGSALGSSVEYKTINSTSGWCPAYHYLSSEEKGKYNYKQIKDVFVAISEAAASNKPIYIHCMGGADRTGSIFFCLGGLLGMNFTDLCAEFEMTSFAKNLRERDRTGSYSSFPRFIQAYYDDEIGFDPNKTHDIQTVMTNMFLKMGMTQNQLDSIINNYLVD